MRQFDLDKYLKNPNRKIVTRDGRSVRIVCTDMIGTSYSVLAICRIDPTHDSCYSYTTTGKLHIGEDSRLDLFFAPEKKSGWINIYSRTGDAHASRRIYDTEEEALECASVKRVDTIKIEWEE